MEKGADTAPSRHAPVGFIPRATTVAISPKGKVKQVQHKTYFKAPKNYFKPYPKIKASREVILSFCIQIYFALKELPFGKNLDLSLQ